MIIDRPLEDLADKLAGAVVEHADNCDLLDPRVAHTVRVVCEKVGVKLGDDELNELMMGVRKRHRLGEAASL